MKYAELIALAVVLIAIGPALLRNIRGKGKPGGAGDAAAPTRSVDDTGDSGSDGAAD